MAFKGVFLEGLEVVITVLTLGASAHRLGLAAATAVVAVLLVGLVGLIVARQLTGVPENAMKLGVGLMLTSFGTFWLGEGLRISWPGNDVAILFHCVPLIEQGEVTGVAPLMRDVSDVRQLNRLVLNKEAAVREVHHRVKNNLQTISSLLRLQARRSDEAETVIALQEAERRVRSIAVVHEVLSREPGEEVVFDEIVRSLVMLVEDTVLALHPVEIVVNGELGTLGTDLATPLAVALTELLTNAVEHAFVDFGGADNDHVGVVTLNLYQEDGCAVAEIRDNGRGLGEDFSLEVPTSLGLSIVRDLIRAQLHGSIEMTNVTRANGGGTFVRVAVPIGERY